MEKKNSHYYFATYSHLDSNKYKSKKGFINDLKSKKYKYYYCNSTTRSYKNKYMYIFMIK